MHVAITRRHYNQQNCSTLSFVQTQLYTSLCSRQIVYTYTQTVYPYMLMHRFTGYCSIVKEHAGVCIYERKQKTVEAETMQTHTWK